jgi:hypothetical protein
MQQSKIYLTLASELCTFGWLQMVSLDYMISFIIVLLLSRWEKVVWLPRPQFHWQLSNEPLLNQYSRQGPSRHHSGGGPPYLQKTKICRVFFQIEFHFLTQSSNPAINYRGASDWVTGLPPGTVYLCHSFEYNNFTSKVNLYSQTFFKIMALCWLLIVVICTVPSGMVCVDSSGLCIILQEQRTNFW